MKRYLIKITAVSLLTAVFFVAGGFCFHELFISAAQAATLDQTESIDACSDMDMAKPTPPKHHNSIMPCCSDKAHPDATPFAQSFEIGNFFSVLAFVNDQEPAVLVYKAAYNSPVMPPPELLSLRSTILRI